MPSRHLVLVILSLLFLVPSINAAQNSEKKALTNQDVTDLVKAGLSPEIVIAKIKSSACNFDTSPAALKDLKSANVPDAVILVMVQASGSGQVSQSDAIQNDHPTVNEILDKYLDTVGRDAFLKRTSSHWKGVIEHNGQTADFEIFEEPNKLLSITKIPKQGEFRDGFDGSVGWNSGPTGTREHTTQQTALTKWLDEFTWDPRRLAPTLSRKNDVTVGNRPAYVVEADLKDSGVVRIYFDKETGLTVRRDVESNEPQGRETQVWYYEDYREVAGRKVPFIRRRESPALTIKFALVEDNVPIDETKFAKPNAGKVIPTDSVKAVAYRVIPQQSTTYIQSGTNSSFTNCYGSGTFSTFGNYGNLDMNTNCNTTYTTPTQIPMTWRWADVYITVEDANHTYLIGCRANWRWSNCEPLIVGDVFPAEISSGTMTISALKNGKKAVHTKYNILQISQK